MGLEGSGPIEPGRYMRQGRVRDGYTTHPPVCLIRFPELVQRVQSGVDVDAMIQRLKVDLELGVVKDVDYDQRQQTIHESTENIGYILSSRM